MDWGKSVFHDSQALSEPERFDPERCLADGNIDLSAPGPERRKFGSRRRC